MLAPIPPHPRRDEHRRSPTASSPLPRIPALLLALACTLGTLRAEDPAWIWLKPAAEGSPPPSNAVFRKSFRTPPYTWNARLTVVADDHAEVFLNGKPVASCPGPDQPVRAEVSVNLIQGTNVLAVRARNAAGAAGLLLHLNLGGTETREVITDATWRASAAEEPGWNSLHFDDRNWPPAVRLAGHGAAPWGDVLSRASATPAESIRVPDGFEVQLLRSATPEEGSWACMTLDGHGRAVISPEGDSHPLLRVTFNEAGNVLRVTPLGIPLRFAMGLLFAHDSLYANAKGPQGTGLYRVTDRNGNDVLEPDEVQFLKAFKGGGEHGYHALALAPDGTLHVLNGNMTKPPDGLDPRSPYRGAAEDVLSLNPDETSRAGGALAPGCQILRTDPEGKRWKMVAGGMRNAYDFDFSPDGELFVYDSDNEWDWGAPWYRATRLYHAVSGAEMGWRDGTRAWADTYPDMVRGVLDVGIGSPCGVKFGTRARFPEKYRRALFLQDWSYGRILAVHLRPEGASYRGDFEEFLRGQPLNLTSMAFGPDGAMYFITGGRGTQSGLYRVRYTGDEPTGPANLAEPATTPTASARAARHRLEQWHGKPGGTAAVDALWPFLGHDDVALRYAARVALESQEPRLWQQRALSETNTLAFLHAALALARVGPPTAAAPLAQALTRLANGDLTEPQREIRLRVVQLVLLRMDPPDPVRRSLRDHFDPLYPATRWPENRELSRILITLQTPGVVPRTLDLLEKAPTQQEQLHYVSQLRHLRTGWTPADRRRYFAWWLQPRDHLQRPASLLHWFHDVGRTYVDGANIDRHLQSFRREAIAAVPEPERAALLDLTDKPLAGALLTPPEPRQFVREWTMADILPALDRAGYGRNFERGRRAFIDVQCYACHRFGNTGGAVGPEISAVTSKYSRRELLETLVEPSRVISEQYQNTRVFLKDGEEVTGRLVRESEDELVLETDPLARIEQAVARADIDEIRPSTVSPMPEGLLNVLSLEEILDLLAYLESGGNETAPAFR